MIAMRGESAKIEDSLLLIHFSFCDPMFALQMQSAGNAPRIASTNVIDSYAFILVPRFKNGCQLV